MKKQSLQRPSERLLARQESALATQHDVTFQGLAVGLALANYSSELVKTACRTKIAKIKEGLGYDSAPELERLLIDEIALCWFRMGEAEAMYSQIMSGTHATDKAEYAEKRLTACLNRYTHAVEALGRVRRQNVVVPVVQVNVARQQIVGGVSYGNQD